MRYPPIAGRPRPSSERNRSHSGVLPANMTGLMRTALAALAALTFLTAVAPAQAQDARPNVLFVMTDDQTVESVRVMTKVKAGLAAQGTNFTQSIATYPLCCPSRATYLTGQYSHNHGVIHNAGPFGGYTRLDNFNTLPVWMQRAGYRTIHVGRYLNGYGTQNPNRAEIPPGWEDWNSTVDPTTFNFTKWLDERERAAVHEGGRRVPDRLPRSASCRGAPPGRRGPAPVLHVAHLPRAAQRSADRPRRPALSAHPLPRAAPPQRVRERAAAQGAELRPRGPHHQAPDRGRPAPLQRGGRGGDPGELPAGAGVAALGGRRRRRPDRHPASPPASWPTR